MNSVKSTFISEKYPMPDQAKDPFQFWQELKRRKVIRVIIVYAAAAYAILELVSIIVEPFGLPDWTIKLVVVILSIGFIITIILSWIYDITPGGVEKTKPAKQAPKEEKRETSSGWKIATYVSVLIIAALVVLQILSNRKRSGKLDGLEKSIAILPFENLGLSENFSSLQDALPIALIMELQNVEGFIIRPRESTLRYKETDLRIPEIAEELNVNYLIKGYLHQQDSNVLADIHMINAVSEEIFWTHPYEMGLANLGQVRRDISHQVAKSLREKFIPDHEDYTDNPEAELAFLTGLNHLWKDETKEDHTNAIRYFEMAVKLDSNFILAHAKLAISHCWMYHFHWDHSRERLVKAKKAIDRIFEIEPENPEGLFALGVYYYVTHDYEKSLKYYKLSEGLIENEAEYNLYLASLYRRQLKLEDAIEYYEKALEADPQNTIVFLELGETNMLLGEYEKAEWYFDQMYLTGAKYESTFLNNILLYFIWDEDNKRSRQALSEARSIPGNEYNPNLTHHQVLIEFADRNFDKALTALNEETTDTFSQQFLYRPTSLYYAEIYRLLNNTELANQYYESARIHLEEKIDKVPDDSRYHCSLGIAYAGLGEKEKAIREGQTGVELMPLEKDFYRAIFKLEDLARIYTMVGEYDQAIEIIDQLLSMPGIMTFNLLNKDPVWEPLENYPRFSQMKEKYATN
jgi:TolB-like protein/tetratricopeptide (TPR) repeat protein